MQRNKPEETVAALDARITRYRQAKLNYATARQELNRKSQFLRIESNEKRESTSRAGCSMSAYCRHPRRACHRHRREISVLELLLKSLESAEKAAKERYMEPIVRRITPYCRSSCQALQSTVTTISESPASTGLSAKISTDSPEEHKSKSLC